ncbi:hypothetical protein EV356DRAFT_514207 [Viridothelium virens]|uniref:RNase H type-1 domain-containing protein n=1 Tax=Viridothelium virens TaxID=1048519 RepID=A0A6A6HC16_VIRVR|nr:hypothetical protein EV356DRAFT_514207 [Viridothelium virens]
MAFVDDFTDENSIRFQGLTITPKQEVKLLGLILDQRLTFHSHTARAAKQGEKAALALRRLQGLRPKAARQLFIATITPVTDYGAPVWVPGSSMHVQGRINQAMKIGAATVTGMFSSAALPAAMVEAGLELPQDRLHELIRRNWLRLQYKPLHHVSWSLIHRLDQIGSYQSPLEITAARYGPMDLEEVDPIPAFTKPPWQPGPNILLQNKYEAIRVAESIANNPDSIAFYTDRLVRHQRAGLGIFTPPPFGLQVSTTLNRGVNPDPTQVELKAILAALYAIIKDPVYGLRFGLIKHLIVTDSKRALRTL